MRNNKVKQLCETGIFAALVFLGVFIFKIPMPLGYTHLGDSLIFLAVLMIGGKRGAAAGAIGAGLADLAAGYAIWILPTALCKGALALAMGFVIEKHLFGLKGKAAWIVGGVIGGIVQSLGYLCFWGLLFGKAAAASAVVGLIMQSSFGIAVAFAIAAALEKTTLRKYFVHMQLGTKGLEND
ncbi:MAG: ECF transporter S component [Anaerovoracaceae bacterium]